MLVKTFGSAVYGVEDISINVEVRYGGDLKCSVMFLSGKDVPVHKNNIMKTEPDVATDFI